MLTVHLNAIDLSRTVVRSRPAVMQELAAAGRRVTQADAPTYLAGWNARTRAALRPIMRPYLDLCRVPRWVPDFLTPAGWSSDFDAAVIDEVVNTPAALMREELQPMIEAGRLPARVGALAAGDQSARRQLRAAIVAFHDVAVAPYWTEITTAVHADRAARGTTMVEHGIDRVLHTLSSHLRWNASKLSYECPGGADVELAPAGHGVILVPSYLGIVPSFADVGGGPVAVCYPIERRPPDLAGRKPLADLLGRTRATVLTAVAGGRSTTEVAHEVGISAGSASQHTSVLRSAGLITTHRTGPAVRHSLTPLGLSLLEAGSS
ncbi:winged helix-turn-helix domain-containing protein [Kribbella sancticallisti]|uniref:Winged helix-turn-helix domain-containing protein n=1 Tax=Kribbella sancticallisti TaxID=460087 RepID=A0ABN2DX42_9ACTN